jgi:hypothetical protein
MLPESWYCVLAVRLNECARPARQVPALALGNLGRSPDWLKMKNPACAAVKREAEEDWGG